MTKPLRILLPLLIAAACGNYSQPVARDRATAQACDFFQRCGDIGEGETFATRDACEVDVRAAFNRQWPVEECDGKIRGEDLDRCLKAIEVTSCGNLWDIFVNTLGQKCPASEVCRG